MSDSAYPIFYVKQFLDIVISEQTYDRNSGDASNLEGNSDGQGESRCESHIYDVEVEVMFLKSFS